MKKILTLGITSLTLILASCGLNKSTPEDVIKQTQINIINKIQQNVFAQKNVEFKSNLFTKVSTPLGSGDGNFVFTGKTSEYTGLLNLSGQANFNIEGKSGSIQLAGKSITTIKKIYFNLQSLKVNIPDPTIQAYTSMISMLLNKRLYYTNQQTQISTVKNINFKNILQKYILFKVEKVIANRNYNIKLNKENITKIILEINKQVNPSFSGKYEENIKQQLKEVNIEGNLKIQQDNLHFEFSGYVKNNEDKTPIKLVYLPNKFKLSLPTIEVNCDINGEEFNGYVLITQINVQIPIKGKISSTEFDISLNYYDQQLTQIILNFNYQIKKLNKNLKIQLPEDAIDFHKIINTFGK